MYFDGSTYVHERDRGRLAHQMMAVFDVMKDGVPRTLADLSERTGAPEASVSARLRDLRKARFGGHTVNRIYVRRGLHQYQLIVRRADH